MWNMVDTTSLEYALQEPEVTRSTAHEEQPAQQHPDTPQDHRPFSAQCFWSGSSHDHLVCSPWPPLS